MILSFRALRDWGWFDNFLVELDDSHVFSFSELVIFLKSFEGQVVFHNPNAWSSKVGILVLPTLISDFLNSV